MGKGDKRRPRLIDRVTYEENWNLIFGKKSCGGLPKGFISDEEFNKKKSGRVLFSEDNSKYETRTKKN